MVRFFAGYKRDRLGASCRRFHRGQRSKRHENMRDGMEAGSIRGDDWRGVVAAVSGAVPHALSCRAIIAVSRPRGLAVRFPIPVVASFSAGFHDGVNRRRALAGRERHEAVRQPMERGEGGWNDRGPELASISSPVSDAAGLR